MKTTTPSIPIAHRPFVGPSHDPILTEARGRLDSSSHRELRSIDCELAGSLLTIRGRVRSYYLKQLAQELLLTIDGVTRISNHLEVAEWRSPSAVRAAK